MYSLKDLTIIVPSLVSELSKLWINQVNQFHLEGIKLIICIPPNTKVNDVYSTGICDEIKVLNSNKKGQVNQRQYAYSHCQTELIMQMDDDIIIDIKTLNILIKNFSKIPTNSCLAPYLKNDRKEENNRKLYEYSRNLILFWSSRPVSGTVAITSYPVPHRSERNSSNKECIEAEWLPGGILIMNKNNIID